MFAIAGEKSLTVTNDSQQLLENIKVEISTVQQGKMTLELTEVKKSDHSNERGPYERYEYIYSLEKMVEASVIFHCFEDTLHAFVDARLISERLFALNDAFRADDAIRIHIRDIPGKEKLVAHYRHKDWWSRPYFDTQLTNLPERTSSLVWKQAETHYQLMTVVGETYKTEMQGTDQGFAVTVSSHDHGRNQCHTPLFVLSENQNVFALVSQTTAEIGAITGKTPFRNKKRYPEKLDYLGWCSWDAFYQQVNEKGIVEKLEELNEKEVPVKWVMIDDGWSEIKNDRLHAFAANTANFPNGLKPLTKKLRQDHGVESIGVWHTLAGYWGGVDPDSDLAQKMQAFLYRTNANKLVPYPQKGRGFSFWDAWHAYLKEQGIDFVKVDGQSAIRNFLDGQEAIGQAAEETHKGLEASVGIHFDQTMINCMGMAPENIWNRPASAVSRSSDDFVPDDEAGFAEHAIQNVYNSYYHHEFYYGDWDMFWTTHKDAKRHALLRAVSGGPIYVSDKVGETDAEVIQPLIYQDGRIIRCDQAGRPTADRLMVNPVKEEVPLKVWNTSNGTGTIAAFHIHPEAEEVKGTISPADIDGLDGEHFIVFDYYRRLAEGMNLSDTKEITLGKEGYGLYHMIPKRTKVTPIGLLDKYISAHTYTILHESANKLTIQLKEAGRFAFVSSDNDWDIMLNGKKISASEQGSIHVIETPENGEDIIIEWNY